jgi:hypothetical protein
MEFFLQLVLVLGYFWAASNMLILANAYLSEEFPRIGDIPKFILSVLASVAWPVIFPVFMCFFIVSVMRKDSNI